MKPSDPRVLGVDLSLTSTGLAHVHGTAETIEPDAEGHQRVEAIVAAVTEALSEGPELVVIERSVIIPNHISSAREIIELGGIVRWELWRAGITYLDVSPSTVKKYATGNGKADKLRVIRAAEHRLGYEGDSSDEADALWLRALGWGVLGIPLVELPLVHLDALKVLHKAKPVVGAQR
jgi:Holliday junction resolvasome RuvABC endonuclease subunit